MAWNTLNTYHFNYQIGSCPHHFKAFNAAFPPSFLHDFLSLSFLFIPQAHWNLCRDHLQPFIRACLFCISYPSISISLLCSPLPLRRSQSIKRPGLTNNHHNQHWPTILPTNNSSKHRIWYLHPLCCPPVLCSIAFLLQFRPPLQQGLFISSYTVHRVLHVRLLGRPVILTELYLTSPCGGTYQSSDLCDLFLRSLYMCKPNPSRHWTNMMLSSAV